MEIRHLKLVKEVADKGSLTKAMDTLFLSQSALSHQLKEAENQLGTSLFHRINKKLVLTGAGRIVLESAEKILHELESAKLSVKKYTSGDTGVIRIATECYSCYHWLPSLMIDFNKEFPNVEIEICPETNHDPRKAVLEGKLDVAIVSGQFDGSNLNTHELFVDEMMALVHSDHPWTKKKYVQARDFEKENVMIHSYPLETVTLFRELLTPAGISPKKIMAIQASEAVIEMVKAKLGVQVIAKWIVEPYLKDKRLSVVPVTRKGLFRTWYAITLNKPDTPQYLENFVSHLKCNIAGICPVQ